jgi:GNAT superfamily N-acetyltransferase
MYRPDWLKFTWNLSSIPEVLPVVGSLPDVRVGEEGDEGQFWEAMERSFKTEIAWGPLQNERIAECRDLAPDPMDGRDVRTIVLEDGKRIVGGSLLSIDTESSRHFLSGIFVIEEYRCRGAGEALLWKSLNFLKENGLNHAIAVTRSNLSAAKYLYPKYNASRETLKAVPSLKQAA